LRVEAPGYSNSGFALSLSGTANMYQTTATTASAQSTARILVTPVSIGTMAVSGLSLTLVAGPGLSFMPKLFLANCHQNSHSMKIKNGSRFVCLASY
jgi:hypothetical protein